METDPTNLFHHSWCLFVLTDLTLDKMVTIIPDNICKCIFMNEKFGIFNQISVKCVSKGSID